MAPAVVWLVAAPNRRPPAGFSTGAAATSSYEALKECLASGGGVWAQVYRVHLPTLRVGTLDSLIAASDALARDEKTVDGVVDRLLRQARDLQEDESFTPLIEGVTAADYVRSFRWDEAKFTSSDTLDAVRTALLESSSRLEAGLKVRLADYTTAKQAVTAVTRRTGGNLLSRSLAGIVKREHVMAPSSEHLTTVYVVVPRFSAEEFLGEYEGLCVTPPAAADAPASESSKFMGVVPRSAIHVVTDGDHALYAVTVFRAGVEAFKLGCRDRRYTVREYEYTETAADDAAEEATRVAAEASSSAAAFGAWTSTAYAESFMVAVHLKALRVYVESVLRYGLPVDFDVTAVFPAGSKGVSRVRKQLGDMYAHLAGGRGGGGGGDADGVMVPGIVSDKEFFPYVSVDVHMPSAV